MKGIPQALAGSVLVCEENDGVSDEEERNTTSIGLCVRKQRYKS